MAFAEKPIPVLLSPQNPTRVCLGSKPGTAVGCWRLTICVMALRHENVWGSENTR
jgi:hypothetical protein